MIKTSQLQRRYGATLAVGGISFEINTGEVVGFLGPNGAGKTTTLRILAGALAPSKGSAEINGLDVENHSIACRRLTGYLPENNPLYEEMEVTAFLRWNGQMRSLEGAELERAVASAVAKCGLSSVAGKDIGELSKGFRQRVGLASAILHNPPVLLLDEPTSGLDPNQALEVRGLIGELRREKTILLSTHLLPEAQWMCDRLIILNKGLIAVDGKTTDLIKNAAGSQVLNLTLSKQANPTAVCAALKTLPGVSDCAYSDTAAETVFSLTAAPDADLRELVFRVAAQNNWTLLGLERKTSTLEDLFRSLTK